MSLEQPPASTPKELREYLVRQIDRIGRIADYIVGGLALLTVKRIDFNNAGINAPTFTTRSAGTKIVLYPLLDGSHCDYALGIDTSTLWHSVPTTAESFKWYGGTTLAATLTGVGDLELTRGLQTGGMTGGTTVHGVYIPATIQSDVTVVAYGVQTDIGTVATAFTCANIIHFSAGQNTIGAGSTVTTQYGFRVQNSLTGATTNYGFYGNIAAGTGRYNFYANGTADNFFNGKITCTNAINSSSSTGGIGYTTGAGGTVTQATSKATGVTLSKVCGTITTHAASLAANTAVAFVLTNTVLSATDNMILNVVGGTQGAYCLGLDAVAAGSCTITLCNLTAGAIAEAVTIRFTILKSVDA